MTSSRRDVLLCLWCSVFLVRFSSWFLLFFLYKGESKAGVVEVRDGSRAHYGVACYSGPDLRILSCSSTRGRCHGRGWATRIWIAVKTLVPILPRAPRSGPSPRRPRETQVGSGVPRGANSREEASLIATARLTNDKWHVAKRSRNGVDLWSKTSSQNVFLWWGIKCEAGSAEPCVTERSQERGERERWKEEDELGSSFFPLSKFTPTPSNYLAWILSRPHGHASL